MDVSKNLIADLRKAESLENRLQQIIATHDLAAQRERLQQVALRLNVSALDCAAALLYFSEGRSDDGAPRGAEIKSGVPPKRGYRSVRYRLDVGSQHQVSKEQIQAVLIEESGVDRRRIGRIDIRHNYTLVELPEGMPADIFQLLSEATVGGRKLAIKRVKSNRRRPPREFVEGA